MPKTIFGTTEKSNFILNMKRETVKKWVHALLCACIIVPLAGSMFIMGAEGASPFLGAFLYAAGFSCILFYLVLLLRKDIRFGDNPAAYLIAALAALAFASYYRAALDGLSQEHINTAMLGELGRYEGLLALFAYFGIFLLASAVMTNRSVTAILDILIGAGLIQSAVAVLQHIPCGFPSDFRKLPSILLLKDVHLSSGLADSPIFYGSFVTLAGGAAIIGAMYAKNITRARFYGVTAAALFMTGLFTSSVVPLIGMGTALAAAAVIELSSGGAPVKFTEGRLKTPRSRLLAITAAFGAILALVLIFQGIYLRDKAIAYTDAYNRLFIVASPSPVNNDSLWKIARERSLILIKQRPLLGVGPDLMAKAQLYDNALRTDSIDRSYNEYLYIAATRGIPSMLVYIGLLGATIVRLVKDLRKFSENKEEWFRPAILTAVLAYSVQAYFSVSAVTVAPFFWLLLGISWSRFNGEKNIKRIKKNSQR